jgi:hypothetical protein
MCRYGHLSRLTKAFRSKYGRLWTLLRLSHGENMGSSPLGSANDFNALEMRTTRERESYCKFTARMLPNGGE